MEIFLIRHGEASQSWDQSPDPGLSELGKSQAIDCFNFLSSRTELKKFDLVSSPLKRAIETAAPFKQNLDIDLKIKEEFKEIPSPGISLEERKEWLQEMFKKNITELEKPQTFWKNNILSCLNKITKPTIIFTHFMVINVVSGSLKKEDKVVSFYPDNCSITEIKKEDKILQVISQGNELQTKVN